MMQKKTNRTFLADVSFASVLSEFQEQKVFKLLQKTVTHSAMSMSISSNQRKELPGSSESVSNSNVHAHALGLLHHHMHMQGHAAYLPAGVNGAACSVSWSGRALRNLRFLEHLLAKLKAVFSLIQRVLGALESMCTQ